MAGERGAGSDQTRGFLFADLRGYTDYVERQGDTAAARLLERYRILVRDVVGRQQGAEIRTEGDSFFVLFPSASRAVTAALEIVEAAANASAEEPSAPIRVGVGVHAGETAELPEGPVGSAVNLAARICAQAAAGEVLVSDTVRGLTRTRQVATFVPAGSRRLKGISEPMTLYRAIAPGSTIPVSGKGVSAGRALAGLRLGGRGARYVGTGAVIVVIVAVIGFTALRAGLGGPEGSPGPSGSGSPTAGPAGTRIIFSRRERIGPPPTAEEPWLASCWSSSDAKLYVADPDHPEQAPYRLTAGTDLFELEPSSTSDGTALAMLADPQNASRTVYQFDQTGHIGREIVVDGDLESLFFGPNQAVLSPDGQSVAVVTGNGWLTASIDGSVLKTYVTDPEASGGFYPGRLAWLSSDELLVLETSELNEQHHTRLHVFAADLSSDRVLDADLGDDAVDDLAASPDGSTVALVIASGGIGLIPAGGGAMTTLVDGMSNVGFPAWSPDGQRIAFSAGDPGDEEVWTAEVQSGGVTRITTLNGANACAMTWVTAAGTLAQPRPSPGPDEPLDLERGILATRTYLVSKFQPNFLVTIPGGSATWYADRNYVDGIALDRVGDEENELVVGRIQAAFKDECRDLDNMLILDSSPLATMEWLATRTDLTATNPRPINLGGFPGLTSTVTFTGQGCDMGGEFSHLAYLFLIGQDSIHMFDGDAMSLTVVDVRGVPVTFLTGSGATGLDDFESAVAPILDSVSFPDD